MTLKKLTSWISCGNQVALKSNFNAYSVPSFQIGLVPLSCPWGTSHVAYRKFCQNRFRHSILFWLGRQRRTQAYRHTHTYIVPRDSSLLNCRAYFISNLKNYKLLKSKFYRPWVAKHTSMNTLLCTRLPITILE
jgi:hypothetical protein